MSIKRNINCIDSDSISSNSSCSSDEKLACISFKDDSKLELKQDHHLRPLYVCSDGKIIMEAFSPIAQYAQDFLVAISEPISRPQWIHEYKITEFSLYAAISVGLTTHSILSVLNRLSKCEIPDSITSFITEKTESFGKLKLVLKNNEYWIESRYQAILKKVLNDETISESRVIGESQDFTVENINDLLLDSNNLFAGQTSVNVEGNQSDLHSELQNIDLFDLFKEDDEDSFCISPKSPESISNSNQMSKESKESQNLTKETPNINETNIQLHKNHLFGDVITHETDEEKEEESHAFIYSFQIKKESVSLVRKRTSELNYPLSEEYHFRGDTINAKLDMDLKPTTKLRDYQKEGLSKMFSSGRARSGIIVLPWFVLIFYMILI